MPELLAWESGSTKCRSPSIMQSVACTQQCVSTARPLSRLATPPAKQRETPIPASGDRGLGYRVEGLWAATRDRYPLDETAQSS